MQINRLELYNFMSYRNCELSLSDVSLCSIVGANGSGKSAIIEAILWALFGHARLGNKDLMHSGTSEMEVNLIFTLDGKRYDLSRSYNSAMRIQAYVDGESVGQGNAALSTVLAKAIGSSKELLTESVVISQGQLSSFINAVPAQRRDLIISALGLERYSRAWAKAKDSLRTMTTSVDSHNGTVSSIQEQINRMHPIEYIETQIVLLSSAVESAKSQFEELTRRREEIIARDQAVNDNIKRSNEEIETLKAKVNSSTLEFDQQIGRTEGEISAVDKQTADLESFRRRIETLAIDLVEAQKATDRLRELRVVISSCDDELKKRRKRQTEASNVQGSCPLCGTAITPEKWTEIINTMNAEISEYTGKLDAASREVQSIKSPGDPSRISSEIETTKQKIGRIEGAQSSKESLLNRLKDLVDQKNRTLAGLRSDLEAALNRLQDLKASVSADLMTVTQELDAVKKLQLENSNKLVEWSSMKKSREALEDSLRDAEGNLARARENLPEARFVSDALSPSGIPLMLIDHYLPLIEQRAQELLALMSDGQIALKLEVVESGTKKGIELMAGTSHLRPIRALSGGEQTRVSLALRVALGQVLAEMANSHFDCLLIDEPEYLDEDGVTQFIQAVVSLKEQYQQIFVMSHLPQIKSAFPQVIQVEKSGNVSTAMVAS